MEENEKKNSTLTQQIVQGTTSHCRTPGYYARLWFTHYVVRWYQSCCQKAAALASPAV
jgi:hypothetical protein